MKKCRHSAEYKGEKRPYCNKGMGCDACNWKWKNSCTHPTGNMKLVEHGIKCTDCNMQFALNTEFLFNRLIQMQSEIQQLQWDRDSLQRDIDDLRYGN